MLNYGLVGLGNLGEKIARNLLKKKFTVKVYDKDQKKVNQLTKKFQDKDLLKFTN